MTTLLNESKVHRTADRVCLQQPRPRLDRLAHGPWTAAGSSRGREVSAHPGVAALHDSLALVLGQNALPDVEIPPHRFHAELQDFGEAEAQHRQLAAGRAQPLAASTALTKTSAAISWAAVSTV